MQQTLYSKTVDDGYPPTQSTRQSTIYTNQTSTPVFDYLRVSKFLGEFTTEVDKARVRKNLGIPDEYSYNWGHIGGSIENQEDLSKILNSLTKEQQKHYSLIQGINSTLVDLRGLIGEGTGSHVSSIYKTIESFHKDLLSLQINVAQNSTDIIRLSTANANNNNTNTGCNGCCNSGNTNSGNNGVTNPDDYGGNTIDQALISQIATNKTDIEQLKTRVSILEGNAGGSGDGSDFTAILNRLDLLETAIKTNTLSKLEITPSSGITVDGVDAGEQSVQVIAHYTKIEPVDVTAECTVNTSNSKVAVWDTTTHKVQIIGSGTATLTFMFRSKSITLKVTVGASEVTPQLPQWVGYADTWEDLLTKTSVSSVGGTWTPSNTLDVHQSQMFAFWVITTQSIKSMVDIGTIDLTQALQTTWNDSPDGSGNTYNVYLVGVTSTPTLTITINV